MKTDTIQQTQRILNLIAKRDLDDDGKDKLIDRSRWKIVLSLFCRKETIDP